MVKEIWCKKCDTGNLRIKDSLTSVVIRCSNCGEILFEGKLIGKGTKYFKLENV
jgi:ribosomal protein S27E